MSEHVHDWVWNGSMAYYACQCGVRDFGDLCKPGELAAERAKVARLRTALEPLVCEGIEQACDECGGDDSECPTYCVIRVGREALKEVQRDA